jgi:hypothetical protein
MLLGAGNDILIFLLRPDVLAATVAAVIDSRQQLTPYILQIAEHLGGMVAEPCLRPSLSAFHPDQSN